jgi:hypothetical protein
MGNIFLFLIKISSFDNSVHILHWYFSKSFCSIFELILVASENQSQVFHAESPFQLYFEGSNKSIMTFCLLLFDQGETKKIFEIFFFAIWSQTSFDKTKLSEIRYWMFAEMIK